MNRSIEGVNLVEGSIFEVLYGENPSTHQIIVETDQGRFIHDDWNDFHRHWKVDRTTDENAMPESLNAGKIG